MAKYYALTVNTPEKDCDKVREAMGKAGAGLIGSYGFCSFSHKGIGRSLPLNGANPAIGEVGKMEAIPEEKIETFCTEDKLKAVIKAIKESHPYEEPAITYFPVEIV